MSDISIIIPTRNRHQYLVKTVQDMLFALNGVELIIVDNSDCRLEHNFILSGNELKYFYSTKCLSVVDNFEAAISYATRKYVAMIGDDDLVSGMLPEIVKIMTDSDIDCIAPWNDGYIAHFLWPGVKEAAGQLWIRDYDWSLVRHSPEHAILNSMKYPGKGPSDLPKIYQGIVSQDVIKKVLKKYGKVFGGVSPDIYSGMLLASCSRSIASINFPFLIPGASVTSTAGEGHLRADRAQDKKSKEHISRFGDQLEWPDFIPDVYTAHTVWALSLYAAVQKMKIPASRKNIYFLYIEMLIRYPNYSREVFDSMKANGSFATMPVEALRGLTSFVQYYAPRIINRISLKNRQYRKILFNEISDVRLYIDQKMQ